MRHTLGKTIAMYLALYLGCAGIMLPGRTAHAQDGERFTLAVLNLDAKGVSEVEAEVLSDKLRSYVAQVSTSEEYRSMPDKDRYEVVERQNMDKIFEEFNVQSVGCVSDSCLIEFGRMLAADRILIGTVGKIGSTYSVSARILDVGSSRTVVSADRQHSGTIDEVLNTVIVQVGNDLFFGRGVVNGAVGGSGEVTISTSDGKKKSKKMWYILGALLVAGAGAGAALMGGGGGDDGDGGTGAPALLPVPPSRPD